MKKWLVLLFVLICSSVLAAGPKTLKMDTESFERDIRKLARDFNGMRYGKFLFRSTDSKKNEWITLHTVTGHGTTANFKTFAGSENGQPCRVSFELKGDDQVMAAYGLYAFVKGASNSTHTLF